MAGRVEGWEFRHRFIAPAVAALLICLGAASVAAAQATPAESAADANPGFTKVVTVVPTTQWTDTGIDLVAGDRVTITATGLISSPSDPTPSIAPAGISGCAASVLDPLFGVPCDSLIGIVGGNLPQPVGASRQFTALDGRLSLGPDTTLFGGRSGSWTATITRLPSGLVLAGNSSFVNARDIAAWAWPGSIVAAQMRLTEDSSFTGVPWQPYGDASTFTLSSGDGPKTVYLQFGNASGTVLASYSASVVLDTTPPTATLLSMGRSAGSTLFRFEASGADAGAGLETVRIEVRDDGYHDENGLYPAAGSWVTHRLLPRHQVIEWAGRPGHRYCVRVGAADKAGNDATPAGLGADPMTCEVVPDSAVMPVPWAQSRSDARQTGSTPYSGPTTYRVNWTRDYPGLGWIAVGLDGLYVPF
ncbi:MAG: hypothetical protein WCK58_19270, partial [Chloroflexota bacterium]